MKPILFESNEREFTSNGLGRLDPISCTVTEERNGQFEVEMQVSINDLHYPDIQEGRLLYVRHDDTGDKQPFEIYKITRPLNGKVTVYAQHITYRTAKITVMPFTADGIQNAMQGLLDHAVGDCPFTFWTDKDVDSTYTLSKPATLRSRLAGNEGSLLDVFGTGEYEWDRFNIKLHLHRGTDSGVVLRYGKDITELKKTTDMSSVWTGVCPFWSGTDASTNATELVTLTEKVIYTNGAENFPYKMVVPLDLSERWQEKPTEEQLRSATKTYITNNAAADIPTSIEVSFISLWQTEEYKDVAALQQLKLCDTLTVEYYKLGVSNTAKITKTVYNVLLERYDSMTIGDLRSNLTTTIQDAAESVKDTTASMTNLEQAILAAMNVMLGTSGGNIHIARDSGNLMTAILVMDAQTTAAAKNIIKFDREGISVTNGGINGIYKTVMSIAGTGSADAIKEGTMSANRVRGGTLAGDDKKLLIDLAKSLINLAGQKTDYAEFTEAGRFVSKESDISGKVNSSEGKISCFDLSQNAMKAGEPKEPASTAAEKAVYLGRNGVSVEGKSGEESRMRAAIVDGKLCIYQDDILVGYVSSGTDASRRRFCIRVVNSSSGDEYGLLTAAGDATEMDLGDADIKGNISVIGSLSRRVHDKILHVNVSPQGLYEAIGEASVGEDGTVVVMHPESLSGLFPETDYQIFLQPYGEGNCYVSERGPGSFTVTGTAGLLFGWKISGIAR